MSLNAGAAKRFKAIAAMSENRVIGNGAQIPWHLPEDFAWFKQMTTGQVVVIETEGKTLQLRHLSHDCHRLLNRAGQLIVDADDDPDYALAVDYSIKTGSIGAGH